jgi:hypothetical protein
MRDNTQSFEEIKEMAQEILNRNGVIAQVSKPETGPDTLLVMVMGLRIGNKLFVPSLHQEIKVVLKEAKDLLTGPLVPESLQRAPKQFDYVLNCAR